jgi:hypothetical protein
MERAQLLLAVASSSSFLLPHCSGTYEYFKIFFKMNRNSVPNLAFYLKADPDSGQTVTKNWIFNIKSIYQKDSKIKTSVFW